MAFEASNHVQEVRPERVAPIRVFIAKSIALGFDDNEISTLIEKEFGKKIGARTVRFHYSEL